MERLDQDTLDQIVQAVRNDGAMATTQELNSMIQGLIKSLKNGTLHTPNRSGGANGAEIIAKIAGRDISAGAVAVADDLTMTGDLIVATKTPASAAATGTAGTIAWDASFLYVCVGTDEWERVAIATW